MKKKMKIKYKNRNIIRDGWDFSHNRSHRTALIYKSAMDDKLYGVRINESNNNEFVWPGGNFLGCYTYRKAFKLAKEWVALGRRSKYRQLFDRWYKIGVI